MKILKKISILSFLLCLLCVFASCIETGTGNITGGVTSTPINDGITSVPPGASGASGSEASEEGVDASDITEPNNIPTSSIPISHLINDNILISSPDSNNMAVLQALDLDSSYKLRVENISEFAQNDVGANPRIRPHLWGDDMESPLRWVINFVRQSFTAIADISDNVCTGADVWCFAINDDGLVFTDPPSVNSYGPDLEKYLLNTQPHFLLEGFL